MIVEAQAADFAALIAGGPPQGLASPDSALAPLAVLEMLAALATRIRAEFAPAAWLVVEGGEVVALASVIRTPGPDGAVEIGYGVAPTRQGEGVAGRAVADLIAWACGDARVTALMADTAVANVASQGALRRNGFEVVGEREDADDGPMLCWRRETAAADR